MPAPITPRERSKLKARAHALDPIVSVGNAGLSDGLVAEIDRGLTAHGLIKVKLAGTDRDERAALGEAICARTDATRVQRVGKIIVLWRPTPEDAA